MDDEVCLGLRLHVPFWCSFRDPLTSNLHRTFPIPPPSTLYGLLAAALGLPQDDQSRRNALRFAVAVERAGEVVETYSKWMKASEGAKDNVQKQAYESMRGKGLLTPEEAVWVSTPIVRQKLVQPVFTIGVLCRAEVAEELTVALRRPAFPLYLGESDDVIDIEVLGLETPQPSTAAATGAVGGVRAGGALANLPCRFLEAKRGWNMTRWLVTVPMPGVPIPDANPDLVMCHGHVWCFEPPPVLMESPRQTALGL